MAQNSVLPKSIRKAVPTLLTEGTVVQPVGGKERHMKGKCKVPKTLQILTIIKYSSKAKVIWFI